jgi:hypothetical protein
MPSIFLCHNHRDKPFARRLAHDLSAHGIRVWLDEAEIKVGESLLLKVQSGMLETEYIGAILSPNSIGSAWVTQELLMAMNLEITTRTPRVLPIYYQDCDLPLFLAHKRYADFRDPHRYKRALTEILQTLLPSQQPQRFTGKEAARLVKTTKHPAGELCGLSQQGITQQYISSLIMSSRDWLAADAKTGRSAVWVADYYNAADRTMVSYGIYDGRVTEFPELHMQGDEPRPLDINYIDSDTAVARAIAHAGQQGRIPNDDDYFLLTRLRYTTQWDFAWFAMFMDVTLLKTVYAVTIDASSGRVLTDTPHPARTS